MSAGRTYATVFFVVLLLCFGALSFVVLRPFLTAIAWAVVLAVAVQAPWRWVEKRAGARRSAAAAIASLLIALVVIVPAVLLGSVLAAQGARTLDTVKTRLEAENVGSMQEAWSHPAVQRVMTFVEERTGVSRQDLKPRLTALATGLSSAVARLTGRFVMGFFDGVLTFLTTMFLLFFVLRDGREMAQAAAELIPVGDRQREEIFERLRSMLESIFRGSLLCALAQGVTGAIGWAIVGLPSAALAGAIMAVLSLLPIGGTALLWFPGSLALWVDGRHGAAIFLAIWGAVVTSFLADNVLKPLLISGGELNTLLVFLGVFGGLPAFGLLGLFLGPIVLAVMVSIVAVLRAEAAASRSRTVEASAGLPNRESPLADGGAVSDRGAIGG